MHTLVIEKATKLILQSRHDNSTGEKMPPPQVLGEYCRGTNTPVDTVEVVEIAPTKFDLVVGKHIYQDGEIAVSPNWVEPPVVEPSAVEPTSI